MESRACASPGAPIVTTDKHLRISALEKAAAMRARQKAGFDVEGTDIGDRTSVDAAAAFQDLLGNNLLNVRFYSSQHHGFYGGFDSLGDQHFFYGRLKFLYQRHSFGASLLDGIEYPIVHAAFHQGLGFLFHRA